MKRASFLVLVLICSLPAVASDLGGDAGTLGIPAGMSSSVSATASISVYSGPATGTIRVPVQQVAQRRALTECDKADAEKYIEYWCLKGQHASQIRQEFLELRAMDIYHSPVYLKRTPEAIYADYQLYVVPLNRVDRYVNMPTSQLPSFQAVSGVGGQLGAPTLTTDFQCEQVQTYVATQPAGGAHRFGSIGETHEVPIGSLNYSWYDVDQKRRYHKPLPPPIPPPPGCGDFPGGGGPFQPGVPY